jgi:hypothetical protein
MFSHSTKNSEEMNSHLHIFLSKPPIIVSGSHRVWYPATNEWLLVRDHPQAILVSDYKKSFIFTLF